MNYILLDLEWNDAYYPKIRGFVNEIVEFGAVKLDEDFNEIDRFSRIVRSSFTNKLSRRFRELTGMTNEQMMEGIPFNQALKEYKNWAGENNITLTWSNSDLYTLYYNCMYFTSGVSNASIGKYVDLQRYFQHELSLLGEGQKNQISLSNAALLFNIEVFDENLHHALDDSFLSAAILRKCYNKTRFEEFIVDTDDISFFERLMFKSRYISDFKHPKIDKSKLHISCPKCKNNAKRVAPWKFKRPWFHARFFCINCDMNFKAAICFKEHFDRVEIKKKVFEPSLKVSPATKKEEKPILK